MPSSDALNELARAVAATGDRQAFAVLFKHFAPRVKSYLVRSGSSAGSAEELAQETMLLLWRKAGSFDPCRGQVSTWIFTIARNLRVDHRRRGSVFVANTDAGDELEVDERELPDPAVAADDLLFAGQRRQRVLDALKQLSAEQASIVQLSYYDDQPHASIALALCIPLGTVKSRIRLAVNKLRRLLEELEP